jgi:hypothetical protein
MNGLIPSDCRPFKPYPEIQDEFPEGVWRFHSDDGVEMLSKKRVLKSKKPTQSGLFATPCLLAFYLLQFL